MPPKAPKVPKEQEAPPKVDHPVETSLPPLESVSSRIKGLTPSLLEHHRDVDIDEHRLSIPDLLAKYNTSETEGLTSAQAEANLLRDGKNALTPPKKKSELVRFLKSMLEGFSALLWTGAALCIIVYMIDGNRDNLWLAIVLIIVVVVTGAFSFYQEGKSSKVMSSFLKMIPTQASVVRGGKVDVIPTEQVVVGDLVLLKFGDRIPADVRIIQCEGLKVDNSSLTGEAEPQERSHVYTDMNPLETKNLAFFSTFAVEGTGRGIVVRTGDRTVMGQIAGLTSNIKTEVTPIGREIRSFMHLIAAWACFLGVVFFIISMAVGSTWLEAVIFLIGIIVANVPEGLIATVTLCLTLTSKRMAERNCLVKKLEAVETLGSTSIICSDKTGTLTQNRMTVGHFWFDGRVIDVFQGGQMQKKDMKSGTFKLVSRCAILCNRAQFKPNQEKVRVLNREVIGDASEAAILKCMEIATGGFVSKYQSSRPKVFEVPFNSTDKYQLSIHKLPKNEGFLMVMKGAPERIIEMCSKVVMKGVEVDMDPAMVAVINQACTDLASKGERVLGLCDLGLKLPPDHTFSTASYPSTGYRLLGLVALFDPPRPSVPDAVNKCRRAGIKVIMVTGDHPLTAKNIANQVGILSGDSVMYESRRGPEESTAASQAVVVDGAALRTMPDEELDGLITRCSEIVFARTSPKQKLQIVESCQRMGAVVAVTGDGVNDAPALKKANIGIAMGISGSDVSKQAADMILLDDNFASIVVGVEEGRRIFDNLKKSIAYTLASNVPEITPFLVHGVAGIPLPLGVIAILCIDLGTDMWPAIALAYERAESDIMDRPPRDAARDHLVNARLLFFAYAQIGVIEAAAGFFSYFFVMAECGFLPDRLIGLRSEWDSTAVVDLSDSYGQEWTYWERKELEYTCYTAFFVAIVVAQVADGIVCKTRYNSIVTQGMRNWCLNTGIIFEISLALVLSYVPGMSLVFKTYPLKAWWWFLAVPFAVIIFLFDESRKFMIRRQPNGCVSHFTNY